ncbi:MAG: hypothetical protein JST65_07470, partial [Acidobacteria bacterium]|nr:hypothetical protein [Acidobacteriota bacterium]
MQPPMSPATPPDRRPVFSYLMLSRVALAMWTVLVCFLPLAQTRSVGAYLIGMYDVYWNGALLVGAATFLLAMAINVSANTIIRTAELRFGMKPIHPWLREPVRVFRSVRINKVYGIWRANLISGLLTLAAVLYFFSGLVGNSRDGWLAFAAAIAGFLAGFLVGYLVALYLTRFEKGDHGWYVYLVRKFTPDGFVMPDGSSVPGHQFSANAFLLSLFLYLALGFAFRPGNTWAGIELAALVSLLLLLTNLCWLLSGLSYLLDRWRFPLLPFILSVAMVTGGNDHVFPVADCNNCEPARTAAEILDTANPAAQPRILVATSGGGILAATWTAKVLGELTAGQPGFLPALRVISSVSGGSVGSMHYVHALRQNQFDKNKVFERAASSSLDAVAWGLAYYDSWRVVG